MAMMTPRAYVDFMRQAWTGYGSVTHPETVTDEDTGLEVVEVRFVTGGHSDNERLQADIDRTMFHLFFWYMSKRGGLTVYRIPPGLFDSSCPEEYFHPRRTEWPAL